MTATRIFRMIIIHTLAIWCVVISGLLFCL